MEKIRVLSFTTIGRRSRQQFKSSKSKISLHKTLRACDAIIGKHSWVAQAAKEEDPPAHGALLWNPWESEKHRLKTPQNRCSSDPSLLCVYVLCSFGVSKHRGGSPPPPSLPKNISPHAAVPTQINDGTCLQASSTCLCVACEVVTWPLPVRWMRDHMAPFYRSRAGKLRLEELHQLAQSAEQRGAELGSSPPLFYPLLRGLWCWSGLSYGAQESLGRNEGESSLARRCVRGPRGLACFISWPGQLLVCFL